MIILVSLDSLLVKFTHEQMTIASAENKTFITPLLPVERLSWEETYNIKAFMYRLLLEPTGSAEYKQD